jgi:hypothetical protein
VLGGHADNDRGQRNSEHERVSAEAEKHRGKRNEKKVIKKKVERKKIGVFSFGSECE